MLSLGYPPLAEEARMLAEQTTDPPLDHLEAVAGREDVLDGDRRRAGVYVEESVNRYVVTLLATPVRVAGSRSGRAREPGSRSCAWRRRGRRDRPGTTSCRDVHVGRGPQCSPTGSSSRPRHAQRGTLGDEAVEEALDETRVPA